MRRQSWVNRGPVVAGLVLGLALPAQAAIVSGDARLGGQAFYDSDLDITWVADANLAETSGVNSDGRMEWNEAMAWAAGLTIGGVSGWRLPTCQDHPVASLVCGGTGESQHLFYVEGITAQAPGVFSNVQADFYWTGTEYAGNPHGAFAVNFDENSSATSGGHFNAGNPVLGDKAGKFFAWAVHSGDVSTLATVPLPSAMLFMGSGLVGLLGWRRPQAA